jgi:GNAT superfamily N-acetyltransferase
MNEGSDNMNMTYTNRINLDDYAKLRASVGWPTILPEQAQLGLDGSRYMLVAYDKETAVGIARVVSDGGYVCYLEDVIVLPAYQRKGIGSELVSRLVDMIKKDMKDGYQTNFVLISAQGKEPFYERFGFQKRPDEHVGHGMAQWIT